MRLEMQLGLEISLALVSLAFLILAVVHFINFLKQRLDHIERPHGIVGKINGISTGIVEFVDGANKFVDGLNDTHKKANMRAAVGYGFSFVATLVSLIILLYTKF